MIAGYKTCHIPGRIVSGRMTTEGTTTMVTSAENKKMIQTALEKQVGDYDLSRIRTTEVMQPVLRIKTTTSTSKLPVALSRSKTGTASRTVFSRSDEVSLSAKGVNLVSLSASLNENNSLPVKESKKTAACHSQGSIALNPNSPGPIPEAAKDAMQTKPLETVSGYFITIDASFMGTGGSYTQGAVSHVDGDWAVYRSVSGYGGTGVSFEKAISLKDMRILPCVGISVGRISSSDASRASQIGGTSADFSASASLLGNTGSYTRSISYDNEYKMYTHWNSAAAGKGIGFHLSGGVTQTKILMQSDNMGNISYDPAFKAQLDRTAAMRNHTIESRPNERSLEARRTAGTVPVGNQAAMKQYPTLADKIKNGTVVPDAQHKQLKDPGKTDQPHERSVPGRKEAGNTETSIPKMNKRPTLADQIKSGDVKPDNQHKTFNQSGNTQSTHERSHLNRKDVKNQGSSGDALREALSEKLTKSTPKQDSNQGGNTSSRSTSNGRSGANNSNGNSVRNTTTSSNNNSNSNHAKNAGTNAGNTTVRNTSGSSGGSRTSNGRNVSGSSSNHGTSNGRTSGNRSTGSANSGTSGNRSTGSANSDTSGNRSTGSANSGTSGNRSTGSANSGTSGNRSTGSTNSGTSGNRSTGTTNSGTSGSHNTSNGRNTSGRGNTGRTSNGRR